MLCGGYVLLYPGLDRRLPAGESDHPVDELALPEHAQGGDAHHAVADGDFLADVNVQLAEYHLAGVLAGKLLHHRRHRPAWRAPLGIEIDHHWFACLEHIGLESRGVKVLHFHTSYKPGSLVRIPKPVRGEPGRP